MQHIIIIQIKWYQGNVQKCFDGLIIAHNEKQINLNKPIKANKRFQRSIKYANENKITNV